MKALGELNRISGIAGGGVWSEMYCQIDSHITNQLQFV